MAVDAGGYALTGLVLGLSSGLSPGPLLTLVISETLQRGAGAGIRVAAAPLLTDLPIVLVSLAVLARVADIAPAMGALSLAGGLLLAHFGWQGLTFRGAATESRGSPAGSLWKGIGANLLNPAPYLFWLTVGGPMVLRALPGHPLAAGGFAAAFYTCLVGSKVLVAVAVQGSRTWLHGRGYTLIQRVLGAALCLFALRFAWDGLRGLGWVG
jgi:threonine/homoserine/homoserine lactone efflux protein